MNIFFEGCNFSTFGGTYFFGGVENFSNWRGAPFLWVDNFSKTGADDSAGNLEPAFKISDQETCRGVLTKAFRSFPPAASVVNTYPRQIFFLVWDSTLRQKFSNTSSNSPTSLFLAAKQNSPAVDSMATRKVGTFPCIMMRSPVLISFITMQKLTSSCWT